MPPTSSAVRPSLLRIDPPLPTDPALRTPLDAVIAQVKYAVLAHASGNAAGATGGLDASIARFVASRSAASRSAARERAQATFAAPVAQRSSVLGRYASVPVAEYRTLGSDRLATRVPDVLVNPEQLEAAVQALRKELSTVPSNGGVVLKPKPIVLKPPAKQPIPLKVDLKGVKDTIEGAKYRKMRLLLGDLHCLEESNEVGADEISIGGTVTTPKGKSFLVPDFDVSSDFDEGETVGLGGMAFGTWDLVTTKGWPHVYGAVIAIGERDDDGFYQFLVALWEKVEAYLKDAIKVAVVAGAGAAIGAAIGGALGAIAGVVVGALIGWIISLFNNEDEILGAHVLTMSLASFKKSYYDWALLTTPGGWPWELHYTRDGSHYRLRGSFKLAKS